MFLRNVYSFQILVTFAKLFFLNCANFTFEEKKKTHDTTKRYNTLKCMHVTLKRMINSTLYIDNLSENNYLSRQTI